MRTTRVLKESTILLSFLSKRMRIRRSYRTIYNWTKRGVLSSNGRRVTLEWCKDGGLLVSSEEAYQRFVSRINGEEPA